MNAFEEWISDQDRVRDWDDMTPTDQMRAAWNAARKSSASEITALRARLAEAEGENKRITEDRDDWKAKHWKAHDDCHRQFLAWDELRDKLATAERELAAEQHRYSELHVTCTALENEADALRAQLAEVVGAHDKVVIEFRKVDAENARLRDGLTQCEVAGFDGAARTVTLQFDRMPTCAIGDPCWVTTAGINTAIDAARVEPAKEPKP